MLTISLTVMPSENLTNLPEENFLGKVEASRETALGFH